MHHVMIEGKSVKTKKWRIRQNVVVAGANELVEALQQPVVARIAKGVGATPHIPREKPAVIPAVLFTQGPATVGPDPCPKINDQ